MPVMYDRVPWAIYCHPEVAWAGPGEDACKEAGIDVVVGKHPFKFNSRAQIVGETEGMVKVVARRNPDGSAGRSASTWSARGSPSSSPAGTSPSTGRRPWRRSPSSSTPPEPHRTVRRDDALADRARLQRLSTSTTQERTHPHG